MKYYKPNPKTERTEEHRMRRKKLFLDKRVKSVLNCKFCDCPISEKEFRNNKGYCKKCAKDEANRS
jgi:hypothetical protein